MELDYRLPLCVLVNERVRTGNHRLYLHDRTRGVALAIQEGNERIPEKSMGTIKMHDTGR